MKCNLFKCSKDCKQLCIFQLHQDDLTYLNNFLSERFLRHLQNRKHHPYLLKYINYFNCFMYINLFFGGIAFTSFGLKPLIALLKHGKYVHAFPAIYPFSYEPGGLIFWILCAVEGIGAFSLWFVSIGVDYMFGLYTVQITGELRLLAKSFNQLHVVPNYVENLRVCVKTHLLMSNVKHKLEEIYGLVSIWMAITGAIALCALMFQMSEVTRNNASPVQVFHILFYLVPKYLQIFSYAWNGNIINEESEACLDSIYYSNWTKNYSKRFKNNILIILVQPPLVLIAKGCMLIQFDMFSKVVKTSVSYFCLLRTLNETHVE